ncbi:MAG: ferrous iron transport protein A [Ignavibacteria bacterium]|nr:ferrous iron transport protein A [Ignavibacteria bacterium]MBM4173564.1 ferrous iron transport protein A [Ignavibacteria bacterium]
MMDNTLRTMPIGSKAILTSLEGDSDFIRRLNELGFLPGTTFTLLRRAPFGGPVEIGFGQSRIAFRPDSTVRIHIHQFT